MQYYIGSDSEIGYNNHSDVQADSLQLLLIFET